MNLFFSGPTKSRTGFAVFLTACFCVWMAASGAAFSQDAVSDPKDMISRARDAYNNKNFKSAALIYSDYLEKYPDGEDRDEAGFFFGQCMFLLRDFKAADGAFARQESKNQKYADQILFYRGEIASLQRDYDRALVFFDRLLGEHPTSMMAPIAKERVAGLHCRMGDQYLSQGAYSLALQHYEQATSAPPELKPKVEYKLGMCLNELGDYTRAVQVWGDLSLAEGPDAKDAALLARFRLARLLEDRGLFSESEANYYAFIKEYPDHFLTPLAREGLARVWARQGNIDQAVQYWKQSGRGNDLIALSDHFALALDYYLHEEYVDAEREFLSLIPKSNDPELSWKARLWLARTYTKEGRADKAISTWSQVIEDSSRTNDRIRVECAEALIDWAPGTAKNTASPALASSDEKLHQRALGISALALFKTGHEGARSSADTYLTDYPEGGYAPDLYFLRGRQNFISGDMEKAEADLQKAIEIHPDPEKRIEALKTLARSYSLTKRMDSANKAIAQAREIARTDLEVDKNLQREQAEIAYDRGEYDKGIEIYRGLCGDTLERAKCPPSDRFRLFWGYYRSEDKEQALEALSGLSQKGADWAFKAGLWEGIMLLEGDTQQTAIELLKGLSPDDPLDKGIVAWELELALERSARFEEAMQTLSSLDREILDAGFYTRGIILSLALDSSDFQAYLARLPAPETLDKQALSEDALLESIKEKYQKQAKPAEIESINNVLQVEAVHEEVAEEGTLWVAKSGLYGSGRAVSLAMLDKLLARHPETPFAGEIKYYKGEDAFLNKDYVSAVSWLKDIKPDQVPEDRRFRLLYLRGQSYKQLRDLESMRPNFLAMVLDHYDQENAAREWLDAGIGLTLTREFVAARKALDKAVSQEDDRKFLAEAYYWKGLVEEGSGNIDAAADIFLSVEKKFPEQGMWVTTALYEAAEIYAQKKEYDKALELYKKVRSRSKGDRAMSDQVRGRMAEVRRLKLLQNPLLNPE